MARTYAAYLLRRWQHADGRERVEVQEVATGARRGFQTLADALAWLEASGRRHTVPGAPVAPHTAPNRGPPGVPPD